MIGLTTYLQEGTWGVWAGVAAIVPDQYVKSVLAAGGTPVLLPPVGLGVHVLHRLDGLVLIGGGDVDPARYGADPHPQTVSDPSRDEYEFALLAEAERIGLPVLCICRGAQVLNVARGGTLHQHLPDVFGHADRYRPAPATFGDTTVTTSPGSLAGSVLGERIQVSSYHHQGIDRLGERLRVTGTSDDGLPQILESTGEQWMVGTQYHPEERPQSPELFTEFVEQSRRWAVQQRTSMNDLERMPNE